MISNILLNIVLLVGSYGQADEATFHTYSFDCETGTAQPLDSLDRLVNPSFLAVADAGASVIAVNENNGPESAVTLLRGDAATGRYRAVASQRLGADGPCHVVVSPDGSYVVTANYSGGSISIVPVDTKTDSFGEPQTLRFTGRGPIEGQQDTPHAHFTSFTPDRRMMIVDDLGTDRLHTFPIGADGRPDLTAMRDVEMSPASGPRHLVFDRAGRHAYLINEIDGMVVVLEYDPATLTLRPVQRILADYQHGKGSGDIHLSPDGRYLYASNRLVGDGIAVFAVDPESGMLTAAGFTPTGIHPRNFAITPDGRWVLVACRDDNRIEIYERDAATGLLTATGRSISCPKPVCVIPATAGQ